MQKVKVASPRQERELARRIVDELIVPHAKKYGTISKRVAHFSRQVGVSVGVLAITFPEILSARGC